MMRLMRCSRPTACFSSARPSKRRWATPPPQYTQANLRLKDALARASYRAPAGTLVWTTTSSSGAAIRAGEPVLDLVDCRRRFVQVALPERKAESIRPGTGADIRLIGSSEWMKGEVVNIMGAAGRRETGLLAADFRGPRRAGREISVAGRLAARRSPTK